MARSTKARDVYDRLPDSVKSRLRRIRALERNIPLTDSYKRAKWRSEQFDAYALEVRRMLMMSIARFLEINRPIDGYYMEFGSHGAMTMRMAWDALHHLSERTYLSFDSFEGLPEIAPIDRQAIWEKGKLKTEEAEFVRRCTQHGISRERLITVKGFFEQTLTVETARGFLPTKAAVIYVDCDLYESTVPVLRFIKPFLQRGTVLVFDDWSCFYGDPDRGERRAFREFRDANPELRFEPYVQTSEPASFICLDETESTID